jgi:hypothetical protein
VERRSPRSRERARERRSRQRVRILRWGGSLLLAAVIFFAGLALGRVIESTPREGQQTIVGTIVPTTVSPAETVTVTVSNP